MKIFDAIKHEGSLTWPRVSNPSVLLVVLVKQLKARGDGYLLGEPAKNRKAVDSIIDPLLAELEALRKDAKAMLPD